MAERFGTKWDLRFLEMAKLVSTWSKDPSTKCGAVIVRPDKTVASVGFNGFPKGCDDSPAIYADREKKYSRVVHAEQNALLHAGESVKGYTMYTWPPGFGPSCDRCTAHIIQAGIDCVVYMRDTSPDFASRWKEAVESGLRMYEEAGVDLVSYDSKTTPYDDAAETTIMEAVTTEAPKEHRVPRIWDERVGGPLR